jgi:hypothetical protein
MYEMRTKFRCPAREIPSTDIQAVKDLGQEQQDDHG